MIPRLGTTQRPIAFRGGTMALCRRQDSKIGRPVDSPVIPVGPDAVRREGGQNEGPLAL